jgi:hypothetical protein
MDGSCRNAIRLTVTLDHVYPSWLDISGKVSNIFIGFSLLALLDMNFDRYLATSYPIFHRTSVTKGKLLTLLAIKSIMHVLCNSGADICCVRPNFVRSFFTNLFLYSLWSNVVYQLQIVPNRQEKS